MMLCDECFDNATSDLQVQTVDASQVIPSPPPESQPARDSLPDPKTQRRNKKYSKYMDYCCFLGDLLLSFLVSLRFGFIIVLILSSLFGILMAIIAVYVIGEEFLWSWVLQFIALALAVSVAGALAFAIFAVLIKTTSVLVENNHSSNHGSWDDYSSSSSREIIVYDASAYIVGKICKAIIEVLIKIFPYAFYFAFSPIYIMYVMIRCLFMRIRFKFR